MSTDRIKDWQIYSRLRLKAGYLDKGGCCVVEYPNGYLYDEAFGEAHKVAAALDEMVILRLEEIDLFVKPDGAASRPYDRNEERFLDADEARIKYIFMAAVGKKPDYKFDWSSCVFDQFLQRLASFSEKTGIAVESQFNGRIMIAKDGEVEEAPSPHAPILKQKYRLPQPAL